MKLSDYLTVFAYSTKTKGSSQACGCIARVNMEPSPNQLITWPTCCSAHIKRIQKYVPISLRFLWFGLPFACDKIWWHRQSSCISVFGFWNAEKRNFILITSVDPDEWANCVRGLKFAKNNALFGIKLPLSRLSRNSAACISCEILNMLKIKILNAYSFAYSFTLPLALTVHVCFACVHVEAGDRTGLFTCSEFASA